MMATYAVIAITVVLCALLLDVKAIPPSVQQSYYQVKTSSILGAKMKMAVITQEIDQDIYILDSGVGCPLVRNCTAQACRCNYASNNTDLCGTPSDVAGCTCPHKTEYCGETEDWQELTENTVVEGKASAHSFKYYRFFVNPQQSCGAIQITMDIVKGLPFLLVSPEGPRATKRNAQWRTYTPGSQSSSSRTLCLALGDEYKNHTGTLFIAVEGHRVESTFRLTVHSSTPSVRPNTNPAPCNVPVPLAATHRCVSDGVPVHGYGEAGEDFYFTHEVVGCRKIKIAVLGHGSDFDLYATEWGYGPHGSQVQIGINYGDIADWMSVLQGDDQLTLSLCPRAGKRSVVLNIGINCYTSGNYTFYVVSEGVDFNPKPLAALPVYGGFFSLVGSTRLRFPEGSDAEIPYFRCPDYRYYCHEYWPIVPQETPSPFWPVPRLLADVPRYSKIGDQVGQPVSRNRTFMSVVILEYELDGSRVVNMLEEQLAASKIEFLGRITNSAGEPLMGAYDLKRVDPTCDYAKFQKTKNEVQNTLNKMLLTEDTSTLSSLTYAIDTYTFTDSWYGCQLKINNILVPEYYNVSLTGNFCLHDKGTSKFDTDPCCAKEPAWNQCCRSSTADFTRTQFKDVNENVLTEQCSSGINGDGGQQNLCMKLYFDIYKDAVEAQAGCEFEQDTNLPKHYLDLYRSCKDKAIDLTCHDDSQCTNYYGETGVQNFTCDMLTHKCRVPSRVLEYNFTRCIINDMEITLESYLKEKYKLAGSRGDQVFLDGLVAAMSRDDCVADSTFDLLSRSHYTFEPLIVSCEKYYDFCYAANCEDTSCVLPPNNCWSICGSEWILTETSEAQCLSSKYCNWMDCESLGLSDEDCQLQCEAGPSHFCGLSEGDWDTTSFPQYTSQSECESAGPACIMPNGSIAFLPPGECEAKGICSMSCDIRCEASNKVQGGGACINQMMTWQECSDTGGQWFNATSPFFCLYDMDSQNCSDSGHSWQTCDGMTINDCIDCQYSTSGCETPSIHGAGGILGCFVNRNVPCQTEQECYNVGACSDSQWLQRWNAPIPNYGACVTNRQYVHPNDGPYCFLPDDTFPGGCVNYYVNSTDCYDKSGEWWTPARDEDTCLAAKGCLQLSNQRDADIIEDATKFDFTGRDFGQCTSCNEEWKPFFTWTPAVWERGVERKLKWLPNNRYGPKYNWTSTLDYQKMYEAITAGARSQFIIQLQSEALCRYGPVVQSMSPLACGCSGGGGGGGGSDDGDNDCFKSSGTGVAAIQTGVGRVCAGVATQVPASKVVVQFGHNSVTSGCASVNISSLPAVVYKNSDKAILSQIFASFHHKEEGEWSVINNYNKAVIGALVGDGTMISIEGPAKNVSLCVAPDPDLLSFPKREDFLVADFAFSDEKLNILIPLGLKVEITKNGQFCVKLDNIEAKSTYFPIFRSADWENASRQLYDGTTLGVIYMLGVLYLISSTYGVFLVVAQWSHMVLKRQSGSNKTALRLTQVLVFFVAVFNIVRCVYFFYIPSPAAANAIDKGGMVIEYVLVSLPTFFYFTAFSIVVIFWGVLVNVSIARRNAVIKITRMLCVVTNIIMYAIFVILVLVFNSYEEKTLQATCGGRVFLEKTVSQEQQTISLVYTIIIVAISLVIGIAALVFGLRLYASPGAQSSNHNKRNFVLLVTMAVTTAAFFLNCIFLIAIQASRINSLAFGAVCLIVTEIIPSGLMYAIVDVKAIIQAHVRPSSAKSTEVSMGNSRERTSDRSSSN